MVSIIITNNNPSKKSSSSPPSSQSSQSGQGGAQPSLISQEQEKIRKKREEKTGTSELNPAIAKQIQQKIELETATKARRQGTSRLSEQEKAVLQGNETLRRQYLPTDQERLQDIKASGAKEVIKGDTTSYFDARSGQLLATQTRTTTQESAAQSKSYSSYDVFSDGSGKQYLPQSGIGGGFFSQETEVGGKRAYLNPSGTITVTGQAAPKQPSQADNVKETISFIDESLKRPKEKLQGSVGIAPETTWLKKVAGKAETAVASFVSGGKAQSFSELPGLKSYAQNEEQFFSQIAPSKGAIDFFANLNEAQAAKVKAYEKTEFVLPAKKGVVRENLSFKQSAGYLKDKALFGFTNLPLKASKQPASTIASIVGLNALGKVGQVAVSAAVATETGYRVVKTPGALDKLGVIAQTTGEVAAFNVIANVPKFTAKSLNAFQRTPEALPKLLADKSAKIFRNGKQISPKSQAQRRKESLNQAYNPNVAFNEGKLIKRTKTGKEELAFYTKGRNIVREKSTVIEKRIGEREKARFTRTDTTEFEPYVNRNKIKGFIERKQPQKVNLEFITGPAKTTGGKGYSRPPSQVRTSSLSGEQIRLLQQETGLNILSKRQPRQTTQASKPYVFDARSQKILDDINPTVPQLKTEPTTKVVGGFRKAGQREAAFARLREQATARKQAEATQDFLQLNRAAEQYLRQPYKVETVVEPVNSLKINSITGSVVSDTVKTKQRLEILVQPKVSTKTETRTETIKANKQLTILSPVMTNTRQSSITLLKPTTRVATQSKSKVETLSISDTAQASKSRSRAASESRIVSDIISPTTKTPIATTIASGIISDSFIYKPTRRTQPPKIKYDLGKDTEGIKSPPPKFKFKNEGTSGLVQGFIVEVKKRGKFQRFGTSMTKEKALKLGADLVERSASRTFRILPSGYVKAETSIKGFASDKFRPPVRNNDGNTFIEKSQFAINTGGEFSEITLKGLSTPRRSKKKKGSLKLLRGTLL